MKTLRLITLAALLLAVFAMPASAAARSNQPLIPLGDDKVLFGGTFTLNANEVLDGDLLSFGGSVTLEADSRITGDVVSMGGSVDTAGEIGGDFIAFGSNIKLAETAVVGGDLALLGSNVSRAPGAIVRGDTVTETNFNVSLPGLPSLPSLPELPALGASDDVIGGPQFGGWDLHRDIGGNAIWALFQALALAAVAVLVTLFLPDHTRRTANAITAEPLTAGGLALVSIIVLPVLIVLMAITIILIPVVALLAFLFVLAVLFGFVAVGLEIGERLVSAMKVDWEPPIQAGVGTLVLSFVLSVIGWVPCIGWLASFLIFLLALGGVLLTRFGTQIYPVAEAAVVVTEPAKAVIKKAVPKKSPPKKKSS
jgi:hypothetical protein